MGLFAWLLRRFRKPRLGTTITITVNDRSAKRERTRAPPKPGETIHTLEPLYVEIDYTDSYGQSARRKISLRRLRVGPRYNYLDVVGVDPPGHKSLRVDRIAAVIDPQDGTLTDAATFTRETLEIDTSAKG